MWTLKDTHRGIERKRMSNEVISITIEVDVARLSDPTYTLHLMSELVKRATTHKAEVATIISLNGLLSIPFGHCAFILDSGSFEWKCKQHTSSTCPADGFRGMCPLMAYSMFKDVGAIMKDNVSALVAGSKKIPSTLREMMVTPSEDRLREFMGLFDVSNVVHVEGHKQPECLTLRNELGEMKCRCGSNVPLTGTRLKCTLNPFGGCVLSSLYGIIKCKNADEYHRCECPLKDASFSHNLTVALNSQCAGACSASRINPLLSIINGLMGDNTMATPAVLSTILPPYDGRQIPEYVLHKTLEKKDPEPPSPPSPTPDPSAALGTQLLNFLKVVNTGLTVVKQMSEALPPVFEGAAGALNQMMEETSKQG
jgi:hypothetical protein